VTQSDKEIKNLYLSRMITNTLNQQRKRLRIKPLAFRSGKIPPGGGRYNRGGAWYLRKRVWGPDGYLAVGPGAVEVRLEGPALQG